MPGSMGDLVISMVCDSSGMRTDIGRSSYEVEKAALKMAYDIGRASQAIEKGLSATGKSSMAGATAYQMLEEKLRLLGATAQTTGSTLAGMSLGAPTAKGSWLLDNLQKTQAEAKETGTALANMTRPERIEFLTQELKRAQFALEQTGFAAGSAEAKLAGLAALQSKFAGRRLDAPPSITPVSEPTVLIGPATSPVPSPRPGPSLAPSYRTAQEVERLTAALRLEVDGLAMEQESIARSAKMREYWASTMGHGAAQVERLATDSSISAKDIAALDASLKTGVTSVTALGSAATATGTALASMPTFPAGRAAALEKEIAALEKLRAAGLPTMGGRQEELGTLIAALKIEQDEVLRAAKLQQHWGGTLAGSAVQAEKLAADLSITSKDIAVMDAAMAAGAKSAATLAGQAAAAGSALTNMPMGNKGRVAALEQEIAALERLKAVGSPSFIGQQEHLAKLTAALKLEQDEVLRATRLQQHWTETLAAATAPLAKVGAETKALAANYYQVGTAAQLAARADMLRQESLAASKSMFRPATNAPAPPPASSFLATTGPGFMAPAKDFTGLTTAELAVAKLDTSMRKAGAAGKQAMGQIAAGSKSAKDGVDGLNLSFSSLVPTIALNYGAYLLLQKSLNMVHDEFVRGFDAVENYKLSVAEGAAFITTYSAKLAQGDLGGAFQEAYAYSEQLVQSLEKMDARTIATGEDLKIINQAFIRNRVLLDDQNQAQVQGFLNTANALKMLFPLQKDQMQMNQEIGALMAGQVRAGDKLALVLKAQDPLIQEHIKQWVATGKVYENLGRLLAGFAPAVDKLKGSWVEVSSTLDTIHKVILREGFKPVVEDILGLANKLRDSLIDSKGELTDLGRELQGGIAKSYETLKNIVGVTGEIAIGVGSMTAAIYAFNAAVNLNPLLKSLVVITLLNESFKKLAEWGSSDYSIGALGDKWNAYTDAMQKLYDSIVGVKRESESVLNLWSLAPWQMGPWQNKEWQMVPEVGAAVPQLAPPAKDTDSTISAERDARLKYLEYVKAHEEALAAVVKAGAVERLEIAKNEYDWGLTDLQSYLNKKHFLTELESSTELQAKRKELADLQAESAKFKADPAKKPAENDKQRYELLEKIEKAQKAVTEAESKGTVVALQNAAETKKGLFDQLKGYQDLRAENLEAQGDYVAAAAVRREIDEQSVERQRLITEAFTDKPEAMQAYWDAEAQDIRKSVEAYRKAANERASIYLERLNNRMAEVDSQERFYQLDPGQAARERIPLLQEELALHREIYAAIQGSEPAAIMARLQEQAAIQGVTDKLLEQRKLLQDRTAVGGAIAALKSYQFEAENVGAGVANAVGNSFKGMEDSLVEFCDTGKSSFASLFRSIATDFERILIRNMITGRLAKFTSEGLESLFGFAGSMAGAMAGPTSLPAVAGGLSSSLDSTSSIADAWLNFAPGLASGGPVEPWSAHEVNERGTELLTVGGRDYLMMGDMGGTVTPADKLPLLKGTGGNNSIQIHVPMTVHGGSNKFTAELRRNVENAAREAAERTIMEHV